MTGTALVASQTPLELGTYVQVCVPTDDLDLGADLDVWFGFVAGRTVDGYWIDNDGDDGSGGGEYLVKAIYVTPADDRLR